MAIIGAGGILELSREIPKPLVLSSSRLNFNATPISVWAFKSKLLDWGPRYYRSRCWLAV